MHGTEDIMALDDFIKRKDKRNWPHAKKNNCSKKL